LVEILELMKKGFLFRFSLFAFRLYQAERGFSVCYGTSCHNGKKDWNTALRRGV